MARENLGDQLEDYVHLVSAGDAPICIPKSWVPSASDKWERQESWQALPVDGSVANYRYGTYHAHEMEDRFELHEDFYDPKKNALRHLFADTQGMMTKIFLGANVSINVFLLFRLRKKSKMRDGRCVRRYILMKSTLDIITAALMLYIVWVRIIRRRGKKTVTETSERFQQIGKDMLYAALKEGLPQLEEMVREMMVNGSTWEKTGLSLFADVLREVAWEIGNRTDRKRLGPIGPD